MLPFGDRHYWQQATSSEVRPAAVGGARRLRLLATLYCLLAAVVFGRVVALEWRHGHAFREAASRPLERCVITPGVRGRILTRDGTVLALDRQVASLALDYRYLEEPPNVAWLQRSGLVRLVREETSVDEPNAVGIGAALDRLHRRLAALAGMSDEAYLRRANAIRTEVEAISRGVNARRRSRAAEVANDAANDRQDNPADSAWWRTVARRIRELLGSRDAVAPPARIIVAEELDHHVLATDISLDVVAEIETHPERYPGARIVMESRREYPLGSLAAHAVGHLGTPTADELADATGVDGDDYLARDRLGRLGIEQALEPILRGRSGIAVEYTDRRGHVVSTAQRRRPTVGRDAVLTIDSALQATAERLLDAAEARRPPVAAGMAPVPAGGAVVVMDVETGALLAAASAPRFDPAAFGRVRDVGSVEALLSDPGRPLFDRTTRMAIPPGSVFKALTAVALLENGAVDATTAHDCRGYLDRPDRLRCEMFQHTGHGHGATRLDDALAWSCNVFFFAQAERLGPETLVDCARRFGFGRPTGIDLPGESSGNLPSPEFHNSESSEPGWQLRDTQALVIGQSRLTVTPMQVARFMAVVANGGRLVVPHVAAGLGLTVGGEDTTAPDDLPTRPDEGRVAELSEATLDVVRRGLRRVVADADGTAHDTVRTPQVAIAGKTGTAQTGSDSADHAWFAGYVPAERPQFAIVVALEHAGSGSDAAGPVAKRLVLRMNELGYFGRTQQASRSPTLGRQ